jgi:hypothetical protein
MKKTKFAHPVSHAEFNTALPEDFLKAGVKIFAL